MFETVWDGARSNAKYSSYINVEYYPTRPAPVKPPAEGAFKHSSAKHQTNGKPIGVVTGATVLIIARLRKGPVTASEIYAEIGCGENTFTKAKRKLKQAGLLRWSAVPKKAWGLGRGRQQFWIEG